MREWQPLIMVIITNEGYMKIKNIIAISFMLPVLGACASNKTVDDYTIYDPAEEINRGVFAFNQTADEYAVKPIAKGYRYVPSPIRTGIRNVLSNLDEPFNVLNNILQADFDGAATGTGRFLINSTIGLAGIMDVATSEFQLTQDEEDFGQTLAVWGVPDGPYVMLPVFGPSNTRDTVGMVVDIIADPLDLVINDNSFDVITIAAEAVDQREQLIEPLEQLEEGSLDFYGTIQSAYTQRRSAAIAQ